MSFLPSLGERATLIDVYRKYPDMARHVLGLAEVAFTMTDAFTPGECEMMGAYVSALNNCGYCRRIHMEAAISNGIDRSAFDDFAIADAPRYGDARWRPVFEYVRALTLAPASVFRGHTEGLLAAGWSEDVIVQLTTITSAFNVLNRLADAFGLSANEEFFALAGQRLAAKGYGGTAKMLGLAVAA